MQETTLMEQDQPVGAILSPVPAPAPTMTLCSYGTKLTREELARVATPAATATHKRIIKGRPHKKGEAAVASPPFRFAVRGYAPLRRRSEGKRSRTAYQA
jgi:hypothetical protein